MPAPNSSLAVIDNQEIVDNLPPDVHRVYVTDDLGKKRYKNREDVSSRDTLLYDALGEVVVTRKTYGRPKGRTTTVVRPAVNSKVGEMIKQKQQYLQNNDLLNIVGQNPDAASVLDFVMMGLAEEVASLGFERQEAERQGENTSAISVRRSNALKAVADVWLKRKDQISSSGVDMDSPAFKRLFKFIMDTFREAMTNAGSRPEMIETVFAKLAQLIGPDSGWEKEAVQRMTDG